MSAFELPRIRNMVNNPRYLQLRAASSLSGNCSGSKIRGSGLCAAGSAPPPPPELPLKSVGSGTVLGGSNRRAFLTHRDSVYVAAEGDVLLGRYRIIRIGRVNLEFEEIGTGRYGFASLEDQESAL